MPSKTRSTTFWVFRKDGRILCAHEVDGLFWNDKLEHPVGGKMSSKAEAFAKKVAERHGQNVDDFLDGAERCRVPRPPRATSDSAPN